jgi:hypothetical protein
MVKILLLLLLLMVVVVVVVIIMNQYQERALSRDKREKLPIVVREKPVVPSPCATISSLALHFHSLFF